jgi:hypothetical protein
VADSLCTLRPGMCMRQADCPDTHCRGRRMALEAADLAAGQGALHVEDGGTWYLGHRVLRLRPEPPSAPRPPRRLRQICRVRRARRIGFALAVPGLALILAGVLRHCST